MLQALIFSFFALILGVAQAQDYPTGVVYRQGVEPVTLEFALSQVKPGSIVVLGEQHGTREQALQQMQVLEILRKNGLAVSVGMEFFEVQNQKEVDDWREGTLSEADFLTQIKWGGFPFEDYRDQALFPRSSEGATTLALNASRKLTGKIAKQGLASLTEEEKALLPPQFSLGNTRYLERFRQMMGDHLPTQQALENYFAAQSTWDEVMAFNASEFVKIHPEQVLVIVVGEFHVQYGGGLPDRLKARGNQVTTFSLVNLEGLSDLEQQQEMNPSEVDGARADFILTSRIKEP